MFAMLAIIFLIAWLFGFLVVHSTLWVIHLLLVLAIISFVWHLVSGRKAA